MKTLMTNFEKTLARAIIKANMTGNDESVLKMIENTEYKGISSEMFRLNMFGWDIKSEDELSNPGVKHDCISLFAINSKLVARKMVKKFIETGVMPVSNESQTIETKWDENDKAIEWKDERFIVKSIAYYTMLRPHLNSTECCFATDFVREADKLGVIVQNIENKESGVYDSWTMINSNPKVYGEEHYENLAVQYGIDLEAA